MTSSNNWMNVGLTTIISLAVTTSFCRAEGIIHEKGRRPSINL